MLEIIYISLAISIYLIIDDYIFSATLKKTHPLSAAQLYLGCEVEDHYSLDDADADFEDYCNYRMNNK
ncbi:MAG: hypothetical protein GY794_18095 [bacterium]|nr:hypothetical protein [Desulfobulbaceae bacterium]MCP4378071.1 hypothetical protein [bacterium]